MISPSFRTLRVVLAAGLIAVGMPSLCAQSTTLAVAPASLKPGDFLTLDVTGMPFSPVLLVGDVDPGPTVLPGFGPIAVSPNFLFLVQPTGAFVPITNARGEFSFSLIAPRFPSPVPAALYFQAYVFDPAMPAGGSLSNGASATFAYGAPVIESVVSAEPAPFLSYRPPVPGRANSELVSATPLTVTASNLWTDYALVGASVNAETVLGPERLELGVTPAPAAGRILPHRRPYTASLQNPDGVGVDISWEVFWAADLLDGPRAIDLLAPEVSFDGVTGGLESRFRLLDAMGGSLIEESFDAGRFGRFGFDASSVVRPLDAIAAASPSWPAAVGFEYGAISPATLPVANAFELATSGSIELVVGGPAPASFDGPIQDAVRQADNRHVALGDFDEDGHLDIACSSSIWAGDGQGGFLRRLQIDPLGIEMCAADFDGDGHLDLVVTDAPSNPFNPMAPDATEIRFGAGDGTFSAGVSLPRGCFDEGLVSAADLDLDGDQDLIMSSGDRSMGPGLVVFRNDGPGLGQRVRFARWFEEGVSSRAHAVVDLDSDLLPELVFDVTDAAGNRSLRIRSGFALMAPSQPLTGAARSSAGADWVGAADLDGDLRTDLTWSGAGRAAILWNEGANSFGFVDIGPVRDWNMRLPRLSTGDFDGDGQVDVCVAAAAAGRGHVLVSLNEGRRRFAPWFGRELTTATGNVRPGFAITLPVTAPAQDAILVGGSRMSLLRAGQ